MFSPGKMQNLYNHLLNQPTPRANHHNEIPRTFYSWAMCSAIPYSSTAPSIDLPNSVYFNYRILDHLNGQLNFVDRMQRQENQYHESIGRLFNGSGVRNESVSLVIDDRDLNLSESHHDYIDLVSDDEDVTLTENISEQSQEISQVEDNSENNAQVQAEQDPIQEVQNNNLLVSHTAPRRTSRKRRPVKRFSWYWYDFTFANSILWKMMENVYEPKLIRIESSIENHGVSCTIDIRKGDYIVEYKGDRIPTAYINALAKKYEEEGKKDYIFRVDDSLCIDGTPEESSNISRYCNHSCDANAKCCIMVVGDEKRVVIVAKRKIKAYEEITWHYHLPYAKGREKRIVCKCGTSRCNGFLN